MTPDSLLEFQNIEKTVNEMKSNAMEAVLDCYTEGMASANMATMKQDSSISPLATFGNLNFKEQLKVQANTAEETNVNTLADGQASFNQSMSMLSQGAKSYGGQGGLNNLKNSKLNKKRFPKDFF